MKAGVHIITDTTAEITDVRDREVELSVGALRVVAGRAIVAEGSSSPTARRLGLVRPSHTLVYGFSARVRADDPNTVALAAVRGGYAGLCDLGGGTVNLAGLLSVQAFQRLAPAKPGFEERLLAEVPAWRKILPAGIAVEFYQAPVCAGLVNIRNKFTGRIFLVGDAAGMSETAFGDGIARSFRQARILEEVLNRPGDYYDRIASDAHRHNRILLKFAGQILRRPAVASLLLRYGYAGLRILTRQATKAAHIPIDLYRSPLAAPARTT